MFAKTLCYSKLHHHLEILPLRDALKEMTPNRLSINKDSH